VKFLSLQLFRILFLNLCVTLLANSTFGQNFQNLKQSITQANVELSKTNWPEAERLFRQITSDYPTNAAGWLGLSQSLFHQRKFKDALPPALTANSLDPTNSEIQFRMAGCYYDLGQFLDAEATYRKILQEQPSARAHFWLGMTLKRLKRYSEAITEVRQAPAATARFANWNYLGNSFYDLSRYKDALYCYQNELSLNRDKGSAWRDIGDCQYGLGDYTSATDYYHRSAELEPTNWETFYGLGNALLASGKISEARQSLETALALGGNTFTVDERIGDTFYRLKSFPRAEQLLRNAVALNPTNFYAKLWLANTLYSEKSYSSAADYYRQASELNPTNFEDRLFRGKTLMFTGKFAEAVPEFEKARELNPASRDARSALFPLYLLTAQYHKASQLHPVAYPAGVCLLLILFFLGLFFLLRKSFRPALADRPGLWFTLCWLLIFIESQFACVFLAGLFTPAMAHWNLLAGVALAALPLLAVAIFAFPNQPWGAAFQRLRAFPWKTLARAFGLLLLVLAANMIYALAIFMVFRIHPPEQRNLAFIQDMLAANPLLAAVEVIFIAPVAEEVLFRGLLFGALEKRCGKWTILWTALVFAIFHLDLFYFLPLLSLGILLGWLRRKSGSVWVSAVLHGLNNLIALTAVYFLRHPH
jgi:tetratricopeptide (TPR) repeat protein